MMRCLVLLCLLVLAACSRPLTEAEETFANDLFGDSLDTSKVRVTQGIGIAPLLRTAPKSVQLVEGTDKACLRTPQPRGAQPPQAFALANRVHFETGLYSSDMVMKWPEGLRVPQALVFAHELTHVWQWQNRKRTGYTPLKALNEHVASRDPYLFDPDNTTTFLDYGYEQQGSIVEEYVCCRLLDPEAPRTARLRALIHKEMPIDRLDTILDGPQVRVPWQGIQTSGICE